jgi:hypothetical protein
MSKKAQLKTKDSEIKLTDLTIEKRTELFTKEFEKFSVSNADTLGCKIGLELAYLPQGVVPKLVVIDLLANPGDKNNA